MASIIERNNKYVIVYYCEDEKGERKQRWETFEAHKDALKRTAEIESKIIAGTFIAPQSDTVADFLRDFVQLYGTQKWGVSVYDGNTALIDNYFNPIIGSLKMQEITPRYVTSFIFSSRRQNRWGSGTRDQKISTWRRPPSRRSTHC